MEDIKQELRQDNLSVKSNAIAKLTYLQMLGYDISWAGFNIIEVMSSSKFTLKRIGYLAASQSFHCDSEVRRAPLSPFSLTRSVAVANVDHQHDQERVEFTESV
jgi:hypothetical protein